MNYKEHIEKVKESFLKRGGYSTEKKTLYFKENYFYIDLNGVKGIVDLFDNLNIKFPLETELSQENIVEENWDSLDDSIGGGMISEAEKGNVCYIVTGFEGFSNKYPNAWELLSILYKNADYIERNNVATGDVKIYVFR